LTDSRFEPNPQPRKEPCDATNGCTPLFRISASLRVGAADGWSNAALRRAACVFRSTGTPSRSPEVTNTDIGILLIALCVSSWAILAALHRHTIQLDALRREMEKLLKQLGSGRGEDSGATRDEFASRDSTEQIASRMARASRKF